MPSLYKSSGHNLDRMELTWMCLDGQVERMNEAEEQTEKKDESD
jgi:hypothetical protein